MSVALVILAGIFMLVPLFFMKQLSVGLENMVRIIGNWTRQGFQSYCELESNIDETTLVLRDGSLATFIRISGSIVVIGEDEYAKFNREITRMLQANFKNEGHSIHCVYRQDEAGHTIRKALEPCRATAKRINLDVEDLFDDEENTLKGVVTSEECWLVLLTHSSAMPGDMIKEFSKEHSEKLKAAGYPNTGIAQNPARAITILQDKHDGFVSTVISEFKNMGLRNDLMNAHQALAAIRMEIDPSTHPSWMPNLPGDPLPMDSRGKLSNPEDLLHPPLWMQLVPADAREIPGHQEKIEMGGRFFGTVTMEIPPQEPQRFSALLRGIRDIPCRISFRLQPNGLDTVKFNQMLVGFLSIFPKSYNRRIKNAMDEFDALSKVTPVLGVTIQATTWADTEKDVSRQMQELSSKMQGWGVTETSQRCGDAIAAFSSGLPGFTLETASKSMIMQGSEVVDMLPFVGRPASAWDNGAALFVSPDGKLMPFQPGSSKQNTWVSLLFAPPGSGKSVLLLTLEYACCVAPGLRRLPLMVVIDVGESVSGLISLLQSGLPKSRQHEAGYFKLQMQPEYAVNILDTDLGWRYPTPQQEDFSATFMTMLATPVGRKTPYPSVSELMRQVVNELYVKYSDKEQPKRYERGSDTVVDAKIDEICLKIDDDTTWWEVVDSLFQAGFTAEATRAQRYAVPLISDVSSVLNSSKIADIYGDVKAETGESLIKLCDRMIASSLNEYKIFGRPTKWDLSSCRVIGLDLNDVRGFGEAGAKQTALMYAFAQNVSSRNFYLHSDMLKLIPKNCPEMYRDFHVARINDVAEEIKTVVYDEFHNTGGLEGIRKIVGLNIREGRKWGIQVMLASQMIDDFDSSMIENATSVYILTASNPVTVQKCKDAFALTDSMVHAMESYIKGPGTFLAVHTTKEGRFAQVMKNVLSPIKYWAFTSTMEDKQIRRKLYDLMPPAKARALLASRFPRDGAFKSYIEQQRRQMVSDLEDVNVIDMVAHQLAEEAAREIA